MKIIRGYKTELKLNKSQTHLCIKHCGAARYAYNWGLSRRIESYKQTGKSPRYKELHKELNELKKGELAWMYEVSKCAPQEALRDLENAFNRFFERLSLKKAGQLPKGEKVGFPRFKSKKRTGFGSFTLTGAIHVFPAQVQLPRLGKLRLKERGYIPGEGLTVHILSATVSEQAGHWFVSVQVEEEVPDPPTATGEVVGVDLGIIAMATVSDGTQYPNPQALKKNTKRLIRLQRSLSRKKKGGKNREKARLLLARQHYRIGNIRKDALHKASNGIVAKSKPLPSDKPAVVGLETLNVKGMLKNHKLARAISDVGFGEFRRQVSYKTHWNGVKLYLADRFFPSSKRCSRCHHVKETLELSERIYQCGECGLNIDRDLNAALNLKELAEGYLAELKNQPVGEAATGEANSEQRIVAQVTVIALRPVTNPKSWGQSARAGEKETPHRHQRRVRLRRHKELSSLNEGAAKIS